ncbi:MAG: hypothetical protein DME90_10335 [Verrucomicrobia bacterium]|nr:MAG: hypothetical protein DME90_10335 [Verrucomicrobiota bacterium]
MTFRALLMIGLVLMFAEHLPAPIQEVPEATPTLKPKREAISKPKSKAEAAPKPKSRPSRSFAGTWSGSTVNSSSDGSDKTNSEYVKASCIRVGGTLTWNLTQIGENPTWVCTDTLRMNADGTVSFVRNGRWIAGDYQGITYNNTGTFSRQGASSGFSVRQTAASSQPTPDAAASQTSGIPVAKPVPNRPGYVYDPFDPNTKIILDCRGKASGTKLKDPFSGKLFIVP